MKNFSKFLFFFVLIVGSIHAKDRYNPQPAGRVFPIQCGYGIVIIPNTDGNYRWLCRVETLSRPLGVDVSSCIIGEHQVGIGATLECSVITNYTKSFIHNQNTPKIHYEKAAQKYALELLGKYASTNKTVFSGINFKGESENGYLTEGAFFDNTLSGHFALYLRHLMDNSRNEYSFIVVMLIKIHGYEPEEATRHGLYQEAISLITPLTS